jgi:hypothetical protein
MGAFFSKYERYGYDAKTEFQKLKKELLSNYGEYEYGGLVLGANTRNFSGIINDDTITLVKNEIQKEIDAEYVDKDVLSYIDMGIDKYEIVSIKKETTKDIKPKYELYYVVYSGYAKNDILFKDKTKAIAEEKMLEFATTYPNCYTKKEYILVEGNDIISRPIIKKRTTKTKPEKLGKNEKIVELHKYVFYGWISE